MKVITFGEIMLRLAPEGYKRFVQADTLNLTIAGAEANVAVDLQNLGICTDFITKVPDNEIGQYAVNNLRKYGVGTANIIRGGNRIGLFYLEKGASQRSSKVIYDRAYSSIATAKSSEFDWNKIFNGADWYHISGITPALSSELADICIESCKQAKKAGIKVSCDINYRKKLWSREQANKTMTELCKYVDVCIANEEDASDVFNIHAKDTDVINGKLSIDGYREVIHQLCEKFPFKNVAISLRESCSANRNNWSGIFYNDGTIYNSNKYSIDIVDRVGGGDSFSAGIIYGLLNKYNAQDVINFAVAASCLKHTIEGDFNIITVDEVNSLMLGDGSGRVNR